VIFRLPPPEIGMSGSTGIKIFALIKSDERSIAT